MKAFDLGLWIKEMRMINEILLGGYRMHLTVSLIYC